MKFNSLKRVNIGKLVSIIFLCILIYLLQYSVFRIKNWLTDVESLPLTKLILTGKTDHISDFDVKKVLNKQDDRLNFFTLEIAEIQKELEDLPWVYSASIRKRWPDVIKIHIVEQPIVAVWNEKALLNRFGEIVQASPKTVLKPIVYIYGDDEVANEAYLSYMKINQLLKVNNFKTSKFFVDVRNSCKLQLTNGITLRIGKIEKLERIELFLSVFPIIQKNYDINLIDYIDLRYDTGLAIGWKS